MLVSGINSDTNIYQASNDQTKSRLIRDNFQQLEQALQSGSLNSAQQAFAALQQLMPDLSAGNKTKNDQVSSSQSVFRTNFNAIGQALKSGNLSAAKAAFTKIQQDVQLINTRHHTNNHYSNAIGSKNTTPTSNNTSNVGTISSVGNKINLTA